MKNIRLFIKHKNLKMLQAFSDESYLYNYIVNNYSELSEDNMFRNPTNITHINDYIYISKTEISEDDILVWNETSNDLKSKEVSYYAILLDIDNGTFAVYNNLNEKIPQLNIDRDTDIFEAITKIENFNKEIENEDEMEM